jgi:hypothetical protein
MSRFAAAFCCLAALFVISTEARAQTGASGIAGVVRDASGGVLPGVSVQAASPALIEKVREAVTDGQGQYRLVDLRPGVYVVTFSLQGFTSVRREGVELPSNFTATINADLSVGRIEETLTVTGASPVVDLQNTSSRNQLSSQVLEALPNTKTLGAWIALTPGLTSSGTVGSATTQDVGGNKGEQSIRLAIHGGHGNEQRINIDGMTINGNNAGGTSWGFIPNPAAAQEVAVELGGGSAEFELGGVQINFVPKDGGNRYAGYLFANYANTSTQGTNVTEELRRRGLNESSISGIEYVWDTNGSLGGPLMRDKLWFFTAHRSWGNANAVAGVFYNKEPPDSWFYTADTSRQGLEDYAQRDHSVRFTWQATERNRFRFFNAAQFNCDCHRNIENGSTAPEAAHRREYTPLNMTPQASWAFTASNRLLFEAGATARLFDYRNKPQPGVTQDTISILEQSNNFRYRAATNYGSQLQIQNNQRFAVSYVTGSHAFKSGFTLVEAYHHVESVYGGSMSYRMRNGIPNQITLQISPRSDRERVKANLGLFVQDQWTNDRLTINAGLRDDYLNALVPEQDLEAGLFMPARHFDEIPCLPCWSDLSPRVSVAYDLFGTGKTALKANVSRYVGSVHMDVAQALNPVTTTVASATRNWTDTNKDFIPQQSELQALSPSTFGQSIVRTRWDESLLTGFGKRPYQWQTSVSLQHEVRSNVAVNFAYFRTSWRNFTATDNLEVSPTDYDEFCVSAPVDSRLPVSGERICGLYDIKQAKFGAVNNRVSSADTFGEQSEIFNGLDLTIAGRFREGAFLSGGMSTGRTATNSCFLIDSPQALRPGFCDVTPPFTTQVKISGAYPLPWDLMLSGVFQSLPGIPITASYVASNAEVAPFLGRNLSGGASNVTVELIPPGTLFDKRTNQLDLRVLRNFRVRGLRLQGMVDLYNAFNASSILSINTTYGTSWQNPAQLLGARLVKFGVQMNF